MLGDAVPAAMPSVAAIAITVLAFVMSIEYARARWEWVNLERGTLSLPDSKTVHNGSMYSSSATTGDFEQFIARDVVAYVDAHYRTRSDPANTGIMGSSMGGLISLYAALKYPRVFGRAGVFSCACWIARTHVFTYARHAKPLHPLPRLYFVAGALETTDAEPALAI